MIDFRQKSSCRSQDVRRERRRLLLFILLLGVVAVLIDRARDPVIGRWFDLLLSPQPGYSANAPIDNRLDAVPKSESLSDNAFVIPGERAPEKKRSDGEYFAEVDISLFDEVRDDTPSGRQEQACSLYLFNILNRTSPEALAEASLGRISYAQLFRQPSVYRGRLVTVAGMVRRAHRLVLPENDYGIREYYQLWLWPSDNPSAPLVIYCLELPKGFPTGMEIAEQAELTGFFFKRCAYEAQDVLRIAPELLAKTLRWDKRPALAMKEPVETWPITAVVGVAAALALLAAGIVYFRTRAPRTTLPERFPGLDAPNDQTQQ